MRLLHGCEEAFFFSSRGCVARRESDERAGARRCAVPRLTILGRGTSDGWAAALPGTCRSSGSEMRSTRWGISRAICTAGSSSRRPRPSLCLISRGRATHLSEIASLPRCRGRRGTLFGRSMLRLEQRLYALLPKPEISLALHHHHHHHHARSGFLPERGLVAGADGGVTTGYDLIRGSGPEPGRQCDDVRAGRPWTPARDAGRKIDLHGADG